jgi:hypothetical protein
MNMNKTLEPTSKFCRNIDFYGNLPNLIQADESLTPVRQYSNCILVEFLIICG